VSFFQLACVECRTTCRIAMALICFQRKVRVIRCTQGSQAPIDCLLHAGGALADGLITGQSLAGIRTVFAAKVSPY